MTQICEACWKETSQLFEDEDGNAVCEDCLVGGEEVAAMKCPLKFRLMQFEGGCECEPDCAWRRGKSCAVNAEPLYVVKLAGVRSAEEVECVRKQAKRFFGENGYVVVDDTVDVHAANGMTVRFGDGE